ncbi:unnamed protein product [Ixodes pacificus]
MSKKSNNKVCCVFGCPYKAVNDEPRHFYCIPSKPYEKERRQRWIAAIRRAKPGGSQWMPTKHSRVCSYHFVGGSVSNVMNHPSYVPTIFPNGSRKSGASAEVKLARHNRWRQRLEAKSQLGSPQTPPATNGLLEAPDERMDDATEATSTGLPVVRALQQNSTGQESAPILNQAVRGNSVRSGTCVPRALVQTCMGVQEPAGGKTNIECTPDLEFITGDVDYNPPTPIKRAARIDQSTQMTPTQPTIRVDQSAQATPSTQAAYSGPDRRTCWFGGYETIRDVPDVMHDMCGVSPHSFQILRMALPTQRLRLSDITAEDKLVMALMKLKLGIAFSSLGALFAMHRSTAGRVFLGVLDALNEATRDWIAPPPERPAPAASPEWLKRACPDCRYVAHFVEVRTELPPTTEQRRAMSAKLVKNHMLKFLVAFAPNGDICFVSKGYGGRTSDASVVAESGFLDLVDAGDIVVSRDGFLRVDVAPDGTKFVSLTSPATTEKSARRRTESAESEEDDESYGGLQVREHIMRMVQRIRVYRILESRLPAALIAHCDAICEVCCVLANLQPNLFRPTTTACGF